MFLHSIFWIREFATCKWQRHVFTGLAFDEACPSSGRVCQRKCWGSSAAERRSPPRGYSARSIIVVAVRAVCGIRTCWGS